MSFIKKWSVDNSLKFVHAVAQKCKVLGGPLSNQLYNLIRDQRYYDLAQFEFDYTWSFTCDDFFYARQIQALVSKQDFLDFGVNREDVAFRKFLASEELCQETNDRLQLGESGLPPDVCAVLHYARRKIVTMLGPIPSIGSFEFTFGPGANTSTSSFEANSRVKLSNRLECSKSFLAVVPELLAELPVLSSFNQSESGKVKVTIAAGRLAFVPKSSKEDRTIVVEPVLNGLLQKGIGSYMKKRFKKEGLDLTDQTRNQHLAYIGSVTNNLVTVDLSSASDTVSQSVVWDLLPYDWACLLDACRTESVQYKGTTYSLHKFSSMGNAFTFELESLIFYSLAYAVSQHLGLDVKLVSTFGDDIILSSGGYTLLSKVLGHLGFIVNYNKTFSDGPFRESCGADYLNGTDIRPCYLRELVTEATLYTFHNFFLRSGEVELASVVKSFIREDMVLYGPDGYGDGHLIGSYTLRQNRTMKRDGWDGGVFDTYTLTPNSFKKKLPGDYMYPMYSIYATGGADPMDSSPDPNKGNTVRGAKTYSKISVYTHTRTIFKPTTRVVKPYMAQPTSQRRSCDFLGRESWSGPIDLSVESESFPLKERLIKSGLINIKKDQLGKGSQLIADVPDMPVRSLLQRAWFLRAAVIAG